MSLLWLLLLLICAAGEQQAVQVAPTYVQLLTLQYTAEQLIRSCLRKEEGKQWMKSVMDTESALSKDAKRFLSSSQSWEAVLDLSGQCQQACICPTSYNKNPKLYNSFNACHVLSQVQPLHNLELRNLPAGHFKIGFLGYEVN